MLLAWLMPLIAWGRSKLNTWPLDSARKSREPCEQIRGLDWQPQMCLSWAGPTSLPNSRDLSQSARFYGNFKIARATLRFWSSSLQSLEMRERCYLRGSHGFRQESHGGLVLTDKKRASTLGSFIPLILTATSNLSADKEKQPPIFKGWLHLKRRYTSLGLSFPTEKKRWWRRSCCGTTYAPITLR